MEAEHGGPRVQWTPQSGGYGVQFDASAALTPDGFLPTWTVWGGGSVDRPTWDIHASPYTPAAVLRPLTVELTQAHSPPQLDSEAPLRPRARALSCPGAHEGFGLRVNASALLRAKMNPAPKCAHQFDWVMRKSVDGVALTSTKKKRKASSRDMGLTRRETNSEGGSVR
ncbi:DUF317 domain-containing protein [Streptomyces nigrescens]